MDISTLGIKLNTFGPTKWSNKWPCNQNTTVDKTPIPCVQVQHFLKRPSLRLPLADRRVLWQGNTR